jgi:hypothetical protein
MRTVNVNLFTLALIVILSLFIGSLFKKQVVIVDSYKHKFDSLESIIIQNELMKEQALNARDSARKALVDIKAKDEMLKRMIHLREQEYNENRSINIQRWNKLTNDELAKEAIRIYEESVPNPLFQ